MAKNNNLTDFLTDLADTIRDKTGITGTINPQNFSTTIGNAIDEVKEENEALTSQNQTLTTENTELEGQVSALEKEVVETASAFITHRKGKYVIPDGITTISEYAFSGWETGGNSSNTISIPDSVTSIGHHAFFCCNVYTLPMIGKGVTSIDYNAFNGCPFIRSVNIPDNVTTIARDAFSSCRDLRTVTIGKGVTSIGGNAFGFCDSLTTVTIKAVTPPSIESYSFQSIPSNSLFFVNFASIDAYKTATNWSQYASRIYPYIETEAELPLIDTTVYTKARVDGRIYIFDDGAWNAWASVELRYFAKSDGTGYSVYSTLSGTDTEIIIPATYEGMPVISVAYYSFQHDDKLLSIIIPDSVTSIGDQAFMDCTGLTSVVIGNSVASIGKYAFDGCTSLTNITIPDSVTSIGSSAFSDCTSLTSVVIGNSVTSISSSAFSGCTSLTSITIPDSVTSIGYRAFNFCSDLTTITIPDSVASIEDYAFSGCYKLLKYDFSSHTSIPTLGSGAFPETFSNHKIIIVPDTLYDEWIAATNWSAYASQIIKASEYTEV